MTGGWIRIDGAAVNAEVGSDGTVFVVNQSGRLYERTGISGGVPQGTSWKQIEMPVKIKHASYDLGYLWLVTEPGWNCDPAPQQFPAAQIDAGHGMVVMTDRNSNTFFLNGSSWSKLGSVPLKHVSVGPSGIWGVNQQNKVYKFVASDFVPTRGLDLKQVDAGGQGQVVGVTSNDGIYCLNANRASSIKELVNWSTLSGALIYFSCAPTGCWGVNAEQMIYFTKISNSCDMTGGWIRIDGAAVNAEVGSDGTIFVVNQSGRLYERTGISGGVPQGTSWKQIEMPVKIKHASYDLGYLWLVTEPGFILKCTK